MKHQHPAPPVENRHLAADAGDIVIAADDYARLRELCDGHTLADELDRAIVVPTDQMPAGIVTMHSRCVYVDAATGVRRTVELVYPEEADSRLSRISVLAPVGSALLGMTVGRSIEWEFPDGQPHRLHVEQVETAARDELGGKHV